MCVATVENACANRLDSTYAKAVRLPDTALQRRSRHRIEPLLLCYVLLFALWQPLQQQSLEAED